MENELLNLRSFIENSQDLSQNPIFTPTKEELLSSSSSSTSTPYSNNINLTPIETYENDENYINLSGFSSCTNSTINKNENQQYPIYNDDSQDEF